MTARASPRSLRLRSSLLTLAFALAALGLEACKPAGSCQITSDCASGFNCINKLCVAPAAAAMCTAGQSTCKTSADCPSATTCNTTGCCVPGCQESADCGDGGACVGGQCQAQDAGMMGGIGCTTDKQCKAQNPSMPICLASTQSCVQCQSTADCGGDPKKSCEANYCVLKPGRCNQTSDCSGTINPACDTTTGFCVVCVVNSDCPGDQICSAVQSCIARPAVLCTQDADCMRDGGDPGKTKCDTNSGACVGCLTTAQCALGSVCKNQVCVALPPCHSDTACTTTGLRHCDLTTTLCVQCTASNQCMAGQSCVNDACSICRSDTDCTGNSVGPHCNTGTGACAACTQDSQCAVGNSCTNGSCRVTGGCGSDADCANNPLGSYCLASTGACVACLITDQCTFGLFCQDNACGPFHCRGDNECVGNGAGPVCDTVTGHCGQCSAQNTATCLGGLICQDDACVPVPCSSDLDCSTNPTGIHCDKISLSCVQCAVDSDCSMNESCLAGLCASAPTCMHDADCTAPTNVCMPHETANYTAWTDRCTAGSATGFIKSGAPCSQSPDCKSGNCFFLTGNTTDGICLDACTAAADCDTTARCPPNGVVLPVLGAGGQSVTTSLPPVQVCWPQICLRDTDCYMAGLGRTARTCSPLPDPVNPTTAEVLACLPATGPVSGGQPCSLDSDCASGMCLSWTNTRNGHVGQRCFGACQIVGTTADCPGSATNLCRAAPVTHGAQTIQINSCALPVP